jgi:hypothetical protein
VRVEEEIVRVSLVIVLDPLVAVVVAVSILVFGVTGVLAVFVSVLAGVVVPVLVPVLGPVVVVPVLVPVLGPVVVVPALDVVLEELLVPVGIMLQGPGALTTLVSSVTAPFRANKPPLDTAPVLRVIDADANIFPTKFVPVPNVAEVPTAQKTLQAWAPITNNTREFEAVVRAEPIWKIHRLLGLPWASRVRVPVRPADEL